MIKYILISIFPILFFLVAGWISGLKLSSNIKAKLIGSVSYLVWLLLISIGFEFAQVLFDKRIGISIITHAFLYSTLLCVVTYIFLYRKNKITTTMVYQKRNKSEMLKPIFECLIAIFMVIVGAVLYKFLPKGISSERLSSILLYLLIFAVGVDLASIKFTKISRRYLIVPVMGFLALVFSAFVFSLFGYKTFSESLVLGSGFGWFSLSGPLVGKLLGPSNGAFALVTDLMREFYGIIFLYLFGRHQPTGSIAVCGATAMDSTLPFVKSNCPSSDDVQLAVFVGVLLTVLCPFYIIIFNMLVSSN